MRNTKGVVLASILLIGLGFSFTSQACTPDGWSSSSMVGMGQNGETGSPLPQPVVSVRFSEFCGYAVTGTSYVQSDHASDTRYIGRFYVFVDVTGAGSVDLFVAYSDTGATTPLFTISYDGTNFVFDAVGAGNASDTATALSGWNCIEFEYDADTDTFNFWVNEDWDFDTLMYTSGPTGTFSLTGDASVETVQLGAPNGMGGFAGTITYDAFEAHRTTQVGALLVPDANGNGSVTVADVVSIINELTGTLQIGQPDCNFNGAVTVADAVCAINTL